MKHKILQHGRLPPVLESKLTELYDVHGLWSEAKPDEFLAIFGHEFVGLVTNATLGVDQKILDALPSLRVVSSVGVGLDRIDLQATTARGVVVGFTPDVLNDCVADIAFALLLAVSRKVSQGDQFVRRGDWANQSFPLATRVSGKRLGIVGMGRIGRIIAKRSTGFDMQVRYHNMGQADVPYEYETSLPALAKWADFLVIATSGGAESQHIVNADLLEALGPKGYVINIARGTVVDEVALIAALKAGEIAGAGLDVYENEPNVSQALRELDNVVLLPHVASATNETRAAMGDLFLENLASFFSTGQLKAQAFS